ncbi:hypothetical protein DRP04_12655 [Archaeoglobales archaeon]|nr:MAG: hypothetical protein DRP04_12655 [Archaeoglobales archaeon]
MSELIYKRPINLPRTGHELITCHYPLRLDTYSGCVHNCVYCYAKNLLERRGYWRTVRKADPKHVERLLEKYIDHRLDGDIGRTIRRRIPFRLGGLTDCFQKQEEEWGVTKQVIEILNRYEYPYLIVTKSPLVAEYTDVIESELAVIQVTITTLEEDLARSIEPSAPKPSDRLKALRCLSESGYFTTARFSPIIPRVNLKEAKRLLEAYSTAGARHVLVEFFRGTEKMLENVEKSTGIVLRATFVKNSYYYRFDLKRKIGIYKKLKTIANELGMSFSICSDGDPVPYYLNDTENCCGTDSVKNFKGVERVASALFNEAKLKGKVTIEDMEKYWTPAPEIFEKFWFRGEFERFVFGLKWNGNAYTLEINQVQDSRGVDNGETQ